MMNKNFYRDFYGKYEDKIIAAGLLIVLGILMAIRYDYYFDLNDDTVMKDILAGVYTGKPESRNIQMMYPMSLIISLLYRLFPQASVYGIFLCTCQFGSFFLIVERSVYFRKHTVSKLLVAGLEGLMIVTLYLSHFIFVQYTVTAALLAGTAAFLFVTSDSEQTAGKFLKRNMLSVVLAVMAFNLRSEMLLLALPLFCVAGVYRWSMEVGTEYTKKGKPSSKVFTKTGSKVLTKVKRTVFTLENTVKYMTVLGSILASIAAVYIIDEAAYNSRDWKIFTSYFNSRTQLYDFQGIPSYEGNEKLYERLGITQSEQHMLFDQYNFGLDDTLDASILDEMAEYQTAVKKQKETVSGKLIKKFEEYRYRTFHREPADSEVPDDYPWNIMVILGYISVCIAGIWNGVCRVKDSEAGHEGRTAAGIWRIGWKLLLLGGIRSILWMYILMQGRIPLRITHSLYLIELCILWAMLHVESVGIEARICGKVKATVLFPLVIAITMAASFTDAVKDADKEFATREAVNETDRQMKEYCRSHGENFYFIDVYSAVSDPVTLTPYSEKMFKNVNNHIGNYDIMGGWLNKSPLYEKKLKVFGMISMQDALVNDDKVYMLSEISKGTEFLTDYYEDQGLAVETELIDTINDIIGVYKIGGYTDEAKED